MPPPQPLIRTGRRRIHHRGTSQKVVALQSIGLILNDFLVSKFTCLPSSAARPLSHTFETRFYLMVVPSAPRAALSACAQGFPGMCAVDGRQRRPRTGLWWTLGKELDKVREGVRRGNSTGDCEHFLPFKFQPASPDNWARFMNLAPASSSPSMSIRLLLDSMVYVSSVFSMNRLFVLVRFSESRGEHELNGAHASTYVTQKVSIRCVSVLYCT